MTFSGRFQWFALNIECVFVLSKNNFFVNIDNLPFKTDTQWVDFLYFLEKNTLSTTVTSPGCKVFIFWKTRNLGRYLLSRSWKTLKNQNLLKFGTFWLFLRILQAQLCFEKWKTLIFGIFSILLKSRITDFESESPA